MTASVCVFVSIFPNEESRTLGFKTFSAMEAPVRSQILRVGGNLHKKENTIYVHIREQIEFTEA